MQRLPCAVPGLRGRFPWYGISLAHVPANRSGVQEIASLAHGVQQDSCLSFLGALEQCWIAAFLHIQGFGIFVCLFEKVLDSKRPSGGKLEVKIRIREPFVSKQVEEIKQRWLIIGS